MTPKLKLNDEAWKYTLSCILKLLLLEKFRTSMSTQMIPEPSMQARGPSVCVNPVAYCERTKCTRGTHYPSSSVIID